MKVKELSSNDHALVNEQGQVLYSILVNSNDMLCSSWLRIGTLETVKSLMATLTRESESSKIIEKSEYGDSDNYHFWATMEISKSGYKPYIKVVTIEVAYVV